MVGPIPFLFLFKGEKKEDKKVYYAISFLINHNIMLSCQRILLSF